MWANYDWVYDKKLQARIHSAASSCHFWVVVSMKRTKSLKQCTVSRPNKKKSETEGRSCNQPTEKSSDKASTVSKPKRIRTSSRKKTETEVRSCNQPTEDKPSTVSKPEGIMITLSSPVLIPRK